MEYQYFVGEISKVSPPMDIYENDESLVFEIDLPGIDTKNVFIRVIEDTVIIEGIIKRPLKEKIYNHICVERSFEGFRRTVNLPIKVDTLSGKACYSDGVIILTFPKIKDRIIKINIEKR